VKFTPTATFLAYALGAVKTLRWRVYVRITDVLDAALNTGTWTEITDRVEDIPEIRTAIEYEVGQYKADSITLTAKDIQYIKTLFTVAADENIEIKVEVTLGLNDDVASDVVYAYSGWVDNGRENTELSNTSQFECYTADELGNRIPGENLTTQYINPDIDGIGTDGLEYHTLPGLYVKDANLSSYVLKQGAHTITYDYSGGLRRAKLNDGRWVTLVDGDNTLGNASIAGSDTERLQVYVPDKDALPATSEPIKEQVIVLTQGETLPWQWYRFIAVRSLLTKIFTELGLTPTYGNLELDISPANKVSFLDSPPAGVKTAMVNDGTDIYLAIGNSIYKRTMSDGTYELLTSLDAGDVVSKMWINSALTHLWIYYGNSFAAPEGLLRRYVIATDTLSAEITLSGSARYRIELVDLPLEYSIVYVDATAHNIKRVDGATPGAPTTLFSQAALGYAGSDGPADRFAFMKETGIPAARDTFVFVVLDAGAYDSYGIEFDAGTWVTDGVQQSNLPFQSLTNGYKTGAYNQDEDRVYYYTSTNFFFGGVAYISAHPATGTPTETQLHTMISDHPSDMYYYDGVVYFTLYQLGGS